MSDSSLEKGNSETKLREMEHRYRSIFENSSEGIFQTTIEGRYLAVNPALAAIYGYDSADDLIAGISDIKTQLYVDPRRRAEFKEAMARAGQVKDFVSEVCRKDGSRIWIRENAHGVRGPAGEILYYEGWVEDVTEKRRAEEALLRAKAEAEEASRTKSEFLATVSHELRTPLNGILGMAEILLGTDIDADQQDCVRTLQGSAETLLALVNDILDISKIEAGKLTIEEIPVMIEDLIDDTLRTLAPAAGEKGLQLGVDWGVGIPKIVAGDPLRLRQCISNLVNNAIKFTPTGEVIVRVRFAGQEEAMARLRFEVEDTGIGIAPDVATRLFQPFTQADASTTRKFGGAGLGLAIVRRLAVMMGGDAAVRSSLGAGSVFHFDVSLRVIDASPVETHLPPVFIVGKDAKTAALWSASLRRAGAMVVGTASDPREVPTRLDPATLLIAPSGMALPDGSNAVVRVAAVGEARAGCLSNPLRIGELRRFLLSPPRPAISRINAGARVFIANANPIEQKILTVQLAKLGLSSRVVADAATVPANLDGASLLLLDCEMRGVDVYDVIAQCRRRSPGGGLKIIGLTEPNSNQAERCRAAGANACLNKPVQPQKLTALLRAEQIVA